MALERIGKRSLLALRADLDLVGGVILIFIHHSTGFRWSQDPTNRILVLPLDPIRTTHSDAIVLLEGTWFANPRFFLYFDPMLYLPRLCRMILATVSVCLGVCAEEAMKLDAHLESLRPLLGKVWRAEFKNPASDKPVVDVAHWERDVFTVRWRDRALRADAYVWFQLDEDGRVSSARMKAIESETDFSFDFQDLRLKRLPP